MIGAYLLLGLAIVAEVIGTSALKAADGLTKLVPSLIVFAGYGAAILLLLQVVRVIPVGIAYAIWSGLGTALIVLVAAILYRQVPSWAELAGGGLIIAGVVVINLFGDSHAH